MSYEKLKKIKLFLIDMDGTFYLGNKPLPGAFSFISFLKLRKIDYLFLTNNSSRSASDYAAKIKKMGIDVSEDQIFTSGQATAIYLESKNPGCSIYLVGTKELAYDFITRGFNIVEDKPDYVILGFDTTLTYEKLRKICALIRKGVTYIATHPDTNCPTENGFIPDIGAIIAFIEASTGQKPDIIIGKPHRTMLDVIVYKYRIELDKIAMIGDRLYTDMALGTFGITTILVLSGETKLESIESAEIKPDFVMKDLAELTDILKKLN
jgi:HAD superfamily hydrolase (TIGR01457 family)